MSRYCLLLLLSLTPAAAIAGFAPPKRLECVVLLHGLWRTELSMLAVAWKLDDAGYEVANVTYPSLLRPIEELAAGAVSSGLEECRAAGAASIHFVTHSLGGILLRQYLAHNDISELGRAVMLGPPNQGSQLADYVNSLGFLKHLRPVPVAQLGTGENSLPRSLGPVDFPLGIIAGNLDGNLPLPGTPDTASDGSVAVEETRVAGMVDFIELDAGHTFMMWNEDVLYQVVHFLENGRFDHPKPLALRPGAGSGGSGRSGDKEK